jgi:sugar/nucleoside kinase (ribokinase family)
LPHVDVLVLSEEDLNGNAALMDEYIRLTHIAIMTQGPLGCKVFVDGTATQVPGFPVQEVDPTGAGDVFAAAFLIRLEETKDPIQAARFANATASFCVQGPGVTTIPSRAQVELRLAQAKSVRLIS